MAKTYEDIVSNYTRPDPEWQVLIDGTDYSDSVNLIEFEQSLSNPTKFTVKLSGVSGRDTSISRGKEAIIKYAGTELFRGVLHQVDAGTGATATLKGADYASELDGDVSKNYSSTNVTSTVNDLIDGTSLVNSRTFQTSFDLASTLTVNDFRVNKTQIKDVNRLMGEYDTEWYITTNGSNNPVFNVTDTIQNDDGGNALDKLKTSGQGQSAEIVKRNTNRNKGDFDGVKVRGYGDGDDQITATAGSTGKGNRVLIYTDKTILTDSQAQNRADNLNSTRTVTWKEVKVKPAKPGKLYGLGDLLTVTDEDAKLDDDFRVVETYYKIDLDQQDISTELTLSNKAQTFISEFETEKEKRESQTDYMQGARNTINESNADVSDKNSGTTVEFNVPQRFTEDVAGQDRTAAVYLDFSVDNYKKLLSASNVTTIDDQTKVVDTTVTNFGDVEKATTDEETFATSDMTNQPTDGFKNIITGGRTNSLSYTMSSEGTFEQGDSFSTGSTDIDGTYISVSLISNNDNIYTIPEPSDKVSFYREFVDIDGDGTDEAVATYTDIDANTDLIEGAILGADPDDNTVDMLVPGGASDGGTTNTELVSFYVRVEDSAGNVVFYPNDGSSGLDIRSWAKMGAQGEAVTDFEIFVPGNHKNSTFDLYFTNLSIGVSGNTDGETWTGYYTYYTIDKIETPNAQDGNENVSAYVAKSGGNFDAGVNSNQNTESLPDSNTTTFGKLDSNDLVLTKNNTSADQVTVKLNGTEIDGSPFSLSTGPPYTQEDIELTNDSTASLNKPGFNSLEIIPENSADSTDDATAYVKGNVTVDHKLDAERS